MKKNDRLTLKAAGRIYPIYIEQECVSHGGGWHAGLQIDDNCYQELESLGFLAELPMYAWNEGNAVDGEFTDYDDAVIGNWEILVDGKKADFQSVMKIISSNQI